jgi:hypothetical protein
LVAAEVEEAMGLALVNAGFAPRSGALHGVLKRAEGRNRNQVVG